MGLVVQFHVEIKETQEGESACSCGGQDRLCGRREHFNCSFKNRTFPPGWIEKAFWEEGAAGAKPQRWAAPRGTWGNGEGPDWGSQWAPS